MSSSLINEAFALLGVAKELEERAAAISSDHAMPSSAQPQPQRQRHRQKQEPPPRPWVSLEESAAKYNEACYLMKRHVRTGSSSSQSNGGAEEAARMKELLVGKIDHYERHADGLLREAKGLKLEDQRRREQQQQHQQQQRERQRQQQQQQQQQQQHQYLQQQQMASRSHNRASSESSWEASHGSQLSRANSRYATHPTKNNFANVHELEATQSADRANRLFGTALDHDERGDASEAINRYLQAVQCYLHAIELLSSGTAGGKEDSPPWQSSTTTQELVSLKRKSKSALDRVKELKRMAQINNGTSASPVAAQPSAPVQTPREQPEKLTPYEIKVLRWSSSIASGVFLPWSDDEAVEFNDSPTRKWLDQKEDGRLPLSDKQKERGCRWAHPVDIVAMRAGGGNGKGKKPSCKLSMVESITPYTIKQHCVSDCSFIAGLCISAAFERRFHRRLVSSLIYPQDPNTGMPVYNPHGVYMVKLWLNGVARRVIVDDLLPVDERGNLLCSHTTNRGALELWVPILEKAYMKLCGGYNFPGSNSGVDLFCLTGWIPERIFFPTDPDNVQEHETRAERAWERLYSANSFGDCLITVSTSKELSEEEAGRVGLFTGHAYAVLGVVQTSNGTRLLQLKNPWASQGWKGRFSPQDRDSWEDPDFCAEVGYDAKSASQHDDGVFWMSWDDVLLYFRNMHMSWNTDPDLFRCRTAVHGYWNKNVGPNDDSYNVGENPQYTITLSEKAIERRAKLWILFSRHVTKQEQEGCEVSIYLALQFHRINNPRQRVWYPNSNKVLSGVYTNNQHVLVCYDVTGPEDKYLSIVLSQYKKSDDLGYTLSCYCTETFELGHPENGLPLRRELAGAWKLRDGSTDKSYSLAIGSAGGSPGKGSFGSNPQWSIRVPVEGIKLQLKCLAPKDLPVNIILARSKPRGEHGEGNAGQQISRRIHHLYEDPIIDTGDYRHGFAVSDIVCVPAGFYTLVASAFEVGQVGTFQLQVFSSKEVHVSGIID